ncbi:rifin [Plasmodium reichenowi]|uniref:Rifin n=1 Tax=Plasmodium reichenowi TaxID=5854 RepID=A0A060RQS5_PLARE|nr:rifin [Plasmodium reichenowi]
MKVYYINILLFALRLNILVTLYHVNTHKKTSITHHTPKIRTTRLLCECDLYMPNYDNDPQMKEVMDNFNKQTQQRFEEYDDRMVKKRKRCKEQCNKVMQKIILKDKLEKELMDKFATLDTDIQGDDIPTCVCEKSIADKVEKGCLRCGSVLGGGVMPGVGILGGIGQVALNAWKPAAIDAAMRAAMAKGLFKGVAAGKAAGMNVVIRVLKDRGIEQYCNGIYKSMIKIHRFADLKNFAGAIVTEHNKKICAMTTDQIREATCIDFSLKLGTRSTIRGYTPPPASTVVEKILDGVVYKAEQAATDQAAKVISRTSSNIMTKQTALIEGGFNSSTTSIYVSIIAIVVIVLIMVIIYLILRYRRKKKMKKKLQYIKLLEE